MSQVLINQYLAELDRLKKIGGTQHESVVREAFKDLLKGCGKQHDLQFIPEYKLDSATKDTRFVDGALPHELRVPFGYWEAKHAKDNLDDEIAFKFKRGYQVFHDLVGEGFNVDHVLIGPAGVFTIETKTWSKPQRGDARIVYDGNTLTVAGREPDRNPLVQAKAQAHWLRGLLSESTGRRVEVQPVVVFPGWFVEAAPGVHRTVWVMEPKGLPAFLSIEPLRLVTEDVKLVAYHLSRHVRNVERERIAPA